MMHEYSAGTRCALRTSALLLMLMVVGGLNPPSAQAQAAAQPQPAPAQPAQWRTLSISAAAIGANVSGAVWVVQASGAARNIVRLKGSTWQQVAAPANRPGVPVTVPVRIAVDPAGSAWLLQSDGAIYYYNYTGTTWALVPGNAIDIGIGADGVVWIVGRDQSISRGAGTPPSNYQWTKVGGTAVRIAVDAQGTPWVVNSTGQIYYLGANAWIPVPGSASDIAVGPDGVVYLLGKTLSAGEYSVLRSQGSTWVNDGITGTSIAAGPPGVVYVGRDVNLPNNAMEARIPSVSWAGSPPALPSAPVAITINQTPNITPPTTAITINQTPNITRPTNPITITQPANAIPVGPQSSRTAPPPNATLNVTGSNYLTGLNYSPPPGSVQLVPSYQYVYTPGSLLCSDPEALNHCGSVDAGFVGAYVFSTSCDKGFYDPIDGGTCWKCPDSDSNGAWIRSADSVDSDTACWRNATSPAVWDKHGLAWDCAAGQFYDTLDNTGKLSGSCWNCPAAFSTRSADPVNSNTACYKHQTKPAAFLKYNGCSTPDRTAMYPNDQRRPGKPFLDVASGISVANNAGGACWACPVADEQGNYLYTERNLNTLIGRQTGNNACKVGFRYTPGKFLEPGLSGLPGPKAVLVQEQVFQRPNALTTYLFAMANKRKLAGKQATQWVADQWKDIAAHPFQNENVRALVYQYMLGHAPAYMYASGKPALGAAEQNLVAAFQQYIQARRTYVAQEALDMYYQWQKNVGATRSLHAESQLVTLFYYGTVPLDFTSMVAAVMVPTATGIEVVTAVWATEAFQAGVATGRYGVVEGGFTLFRAFASLETFLALDTVAQVDLMAGPIAIAQAGITMTAIAIQQVVQIETAEQDLKNARDKAKNTTIDLNALYNGDSGPDQVAMYWAFATGLPTEQEDPQLLAGAQAGYAAAQKANFAKGK